MHLVSLFRVGHEVKRYDMYGWNQVCLHAHLIIDSVRLCFDSWFLKVLWFMRSYPRVSVRVGLTQLGCIIDLWYQMARLPLFSHAKPTGLHLVFLASVGQDEVKRM